MTTRTSLLARRTSALALALTCTASACSEAVTTPVAAGGQSNVGASVAGVSAAGAASSAAAGISSSSSGSAAASGESGGGAGAAAAGQGHGAASGRSAGGTSESGGSGAGSGGTRAGAGGAAAAVDLFDGTDLNGFNVYRQNQEKAPGTLLSTEQALAVFKPEAGTLHVYADAPDQSPQLHYTLVTSQSYSKYKLTWEYKWGTKKFAPYTDLAKYPRDAGVLWHLHGDLTQLWPSSIEFQNKDGTTGDVFALYARCTSPGSAGDQTTFAEGGASVLVDGSNGFVQHHRSANYEVPGDWTPCLLEVDAGTAVYSVNGHVVNRVLSVMDAKGRPVSSGPIAWQAEQAEVFYRRLRIEVLP